MNPLDPVLEWYDNAVALIKVYPLAAQHAPQLLSGAPASMPRSVQAANALVAGVSTELLDFAILGLFAAFEAAVKDHFAKSAGAIAAGIASVEQQRILRAAAAAAPYDRWHFDDVLACYKRAPGEPQPGVDINDLGVVKQYYEYRNWVAHGRSTINLPSINQPTALKVHRRLTKFLTDAAII